jgi:23S rRNA (cytosine1962-C5)-methyltransferase
MKKRPSRPIEPRRGPPGDRLASDSGPERLTRSRSRDLPPGRTDRARTGAGRSSGSPTPGKIPKRPLAELLAQRPLDTPDATAAPAIEVRAPVDHPFLYRRRLGAFGPHLSPGELVRLTVNAQTWGWGLFNPHAEIAVRLLTRDPHPPDLAWWQSQLASAVEWRRTGLRLDDQTTAYRVVHAEADGLPGLVVDRFGDVLVVEAFSLGMYQRAEALLDLLSPLCGTSQALLRTGPFTNLQEGFAADPVGSEHLPEKVIITEAGTSFRVQFAGGHKTGFYCDQRENRLRLAELCAGKSVLDVCSYTGGFAVQAKVRGQADAVTGVEVDESSVLSARENARLNRAKVQFIQADAFPYLRDMLRNGAQYDVLVLDPPKLIFDRESIGEGKRKYFDLNRLALQLVSPGGVLLTCSCSGLLTRDEFSRLLQAAAHDVGRTLQCFHLSGAAADHPVSSWCPESEYLKTFWFRVSGNGKSAVDRPA